MPVESALWKRKVHLNVKVAAILVRIGAQVQIGRMDFVMIQIFEVGDVRTIGK